jgi:4-carboxymuconolactone decarboxylase
VSRHPTPRLRPVPDGLVPARDLVGESGGRVKNEFASNITATMAHNPRVQAAVSALGQALVFHGQWSDRERELMILRVAWNCRSEYEFAQHAGLATAAGVTDAELDAIAGGDLKSFSSREMNLITSVDEMCTGNDISDQTWQQVSSSETNASLVELLVLVGFYRMMAGFLTTTRVALEKGISGWPAGSSERMKVAAKSFKRVVSDS